MKMGESGRLKDRPNSSGASAHESSTIPYQPFIAGNAEAIDLEVVYGDNDMDAAEIASDENSEDVIGFSIGKEQLRMKSPLTPAFEKTEALNQSKDYFDLGPEDGDVDHEQTKPETNYDTQEPSVTTDGLVEDIGGPARQLFATDPSRSTTSKNILRDGFGARTRRASSESIRMVGTLKKLLPDLPSISFSKGPSLPTFGFGSKSKGETLLNRAKRSSTLFSRGNLFWTSPALPPDRAVASMVDAESPDGETPNSSEFTLPGNDSTGTKDANGNSAFDSPEWNLLSPRISANRHGLRRATSDNSLFLRNDLHRTTTLDDAEKWADVSGQINSRFKAITDSLQDSAFVRFPKMPSVNLGPFRSSLQRSNSDAARLNMDRNVAITQSDAKTTDIGAIGGSPSQPDQQRKLPHSILNQAILDLIGDVVVLGGYRGSVLRSAKAPNKQLWVPVKVLNLHSTAHMPFTLSDKASRLGLISVVLT